MGSTPPDHVQNGVRSIAAKRQVTLSECESEYDAARNWLAKAIESSRRQILESAGLDLERDEEQRQHNDKKRRVGSLGKPGGTRSVADEVVVAASAVADQKENVVNMTTMTTDEETKKPVKSAKGGKKKKKKKTTKKTSGKAAPKQPAAKVQQPTLDVYSLKVAQLRAELRSRGMDAAGLKRDLQARLAQRIEQEMREAAAGDDDDEHGKDSDDDEEEEMEEEKEEESNVEAMDNDNNADEMHVEEGEEEGKPAADAGVGTTTAYASESVVQLMSPEQIAAASDFPGVDVKALSAKKANPPPANLPAAAKKISFALDDKILTNEDGEIEEVEVVKDDVEEDDDASIGYDDAMEIDSSAPVVTGSETGGEEDVDMMDATSPSSSSTHRVTSSTGQDIAGTASSSEQQQPVQVHADDSIKSPKKKGLGKKILSATANLFSPPTKKSKSPTPKSTQQAQMNEVETKPTSETIPPREQTTDAPALAPPSERKVKEANDFFSKFATTDQPAAASATVVPPPTKIGSALKTPALRTGLASTAITTSSKSTSGGSKGSVASSASKSSASSAYTSEKSQQRIRELQENAAARKARLAELRAKSKPVPSAKHDSVHNYNPSGGTLMTAAQVAKAKAMSTAEKQKEEKKKLLAAQMREKHFAEAKKQTAVAPTAAAPSVPAIPSQNSNLHVPSAAQPQPNVHSQQYQSKPKTPSQPVPRPEVLSPMDTYEMSDREESDSSDYDSDEDEKARKKIPKWAQKHNLIPALERQFMDGPQRLDPDEIFPEVSTCNLELVFDQKKARYKKRTSSANWAKDRVTAAEKLVYKRTMGFAGKKR